MGLINEIFDLTGKVAVITGGGAGLGKVFGRAFAGSGANVVLAARKVERCEEAAQELHKYGIKAIPVKTDVSKEEDCKRLVEITMKEFGKIDILVNNAAATWGEPFLGYSLQGWKKVIDVNLTGTFILSREASKVMVTQNSGKIINVSSVNGYVGSDPNLQQTIAYHSSKGAIVAFTKDLAMTLAPHNIQVNVLVPGYFSSGLTRLHPQLDKMISLHPLGRLGEENELIGASIFLASNASNFMTGAELVIDGGYLAR